MVTRTKNHPKHQMVYYKASKDLRISCRKRHISWWAKKEDGELVPTDRVIELAENNGYDFKDILWYVRKLQVWYASGWFDRFDLEPEHGEGTLRGGIEWTTDPNEVLHRGDFLLKGVDFDRKSLALTQTGLRRKDHKLTLVTGYAGDSFRGHRRTYDVLLKTSSERGDS